MHSSGPGVRAENRLGDVAKASAQSFPPSVLLLLIHSYTLMHHITSITKHGPFYCDIRTYKYNMLELQIEYNWLIDYIYNDWYLWGFVSYIILNIWGFWTFWSDNMSNLKRSPWVLGMGIHHFFLILQNNLLIEKIIEINYRKYNR